MDQSFTDSERAARVRATAPAVDALFAEALGELGAPGIAYGVALDGELVHSGGCGVRSLESGTPPDADTAFRICSMTKSFMAMTVLSLRDEGRLDIDAPLGEVAPDLRELAQAGLDAPAVTVRQLLTMDAGLPQDDPWADRLMAEDSGWVREHLFARGGTRSRAPGTHFEYSNYSWAALGRVVATVTGRRHQDVVRERVLEPLGLARTVWSAGDLPPQRVATGYRPAGEGFTAEVPLADGGDFAALGGLYSSVRDLARWSGVFLDAEPPRDAPESAPVSRATLREMQRARSAFRPSVEWPSLAEPPGVVAGGYGYGLMIWHERDGQRHVGHPGGLPGFGTLMRWVPETGLGVILLANVTYARARGRCGARSSWSRARPRCPADRPRRSRPARRARRGRRPGRALGRRRCRRACSRATSISTARWPSAARSWRSCAGATARCGATATSSTTTPCAEAGACAASAGTSTWRSRSRRPCRRWCRRSRSSPCCRRQGALAPLATSATSLASEPDASALGALLAPAVDAEAALRGLRVAAALYGPFGDPDPIAGDGEATTTLRLPGPRGDVELELELDADSERLARVIARPAGLTERF